MKIFYHQRFLATDGNHFHSNLHFAPERISIYLRRYFLYVRLGHFRINHYLLGGEMLRGSGNIFTCKQRNLPGSVNNDCSVLYYSNNKPHTELQGAKISVSCCLDYRRHETPYLLPVSDGRLCMQIAQ